MGGWGWTLNPGSQWVAPKQFGLWWMCTPDDTLCSLRIQNLPTDGNPSMGLETLSEQMRITTATYSHGQTIHVGKKEKRPWCYIDMDWLYHDLSLFSLFSYPNLTMPWQPAFPTARSWLPGPCFLTHDPVRIPSPPPWLASWCWTR